MHPAGDVRAFSASAARTASGCQQAAPASRMQVLLEGLDRVLFALHLDTEAAFDMSLMRFSPRGLLDEFEDGMPACWVVEGSRWRDVVGVDGVGDELLAAVNEVGELVPFRGDPVRRARAEEVVVGRNATSACGLDRGS